MPETLEAADVVEDLRGLTAHVTSGLARAKLNELIARYEELAGPPEVDNEDVMGGPDEPNLYADADLDEEEDTGEDL
jgi:hypothetical protein